MSSYNLERVKEVAGGDQEFIKVVVQTFLEEIPPDLRAMNEAVAGNNPDLAYQHAHKMKPNFQMFGLELISKIRLIEEWTTSGKSISEVESASAEITAKVQSAMEALKQDFEL